MDTIIKNVEYVPSKYKDLHQELCKFRDKVYAHSDVILWDAKKDDQTSLYTRDISNRWPLLPVELRNDHVSSFVIDDLSHFKELISAVLDKLDVEESSS